MLARAGEDPRHQREHLAQAVGRRGSRAHEPSRAGVSAATGSQPLHHVVAH